MAPIFSPSGCGVSLIRCPSVRERFIRWAPGHRDRHQCAVSGGRLTAPYDGVFSHAAAHIKEDEWAAPVHQPQATEVGGLYEISGDHGLALHLDGARLANRHRRLPPQTWKIHVHVL